VRTSSAGFPDHIHTRVYIHTHPCANVHAQTHASTYVNLHRNQNKTHAFERKKARERERMRIGEGDH